MFQIQQRFMVGWGCARLFTDKLATKKYRVEYQTLADAQRAFDDRSAWYYNMEASSTFRILDLETLTVHPVIEEKKSSAVPVRAGDIKPSALNEDYKKRGAPGTGWLRREDYGPVFFPFAPICLDYKKRKNPPFPPEQKSVLGEDYREAQREINRVASERAEAFTADRRKGYRVLLPEPDRRKDAAMRARFQGIYNCTPHIGATPAKDDGIKTGIRAAMKDNGG